MTGFLQLDAALLVGNFAIHSLIVGSGLWMASILLRRRNIELEHSLLQAAFPLLLVLPLVSALSMQCDLGFWKIAGPTSIDTPSIRPGGEGGFVAGSQLRSDDLTGTVTLPGALIGILVIALFVKGLVAACQLVHLYRLGRPPGQDEQQRLTRLWTDLQVRRPPSVRISKRIGPLAAGCWRPFILFPTYQWAEYRNVRAALAHEQAHISLGHTRLALIVSLASVVHCLNPFFYYLRRRLDLLQEFAADHAASRMIGSRRRYLEALLNLVDTDVDTQTAIAVHFDARSSLAARIKHLFTNKEEEKPMEKSQLRSRHAVTRAGVVLATIMLPLLLNVSIQAQSPATATAEQPVPVDVREGVPILNELPLIGRLFRQDEAKRPKAVEHATPVQVVEEGVPFLSNVPFVGRLFKNVRAIRPEANEHATPVQVEVGVTVDVPFLNNVPYVSRLFRNVKTIRPRNKVQEVPVEVREGVPFLKNVPYVNRLFRNVKAIRPEANTVPNLQNLPVPEKRNHNDQ